jgi:hemolysin III
MFMRALYHGSGCHRYHIDENRQECLLETIQAGYKIYIMEEQTEHNLEERLNAVTHSMGVGMSIVGLVFLLLLTSWKTGSTAAYIGFSIYGASQIFLYLSSTMTHQFTDKPRFHSVARIFDQVTIYYLIAGTYTPVALLILPRKTGLIMLIMAWGFALFGTVLKGAIFKKPHYATDLLYLLMGWLIVFFIRPMIEYSPDGFLKWIVIGGLFYSVGIVFYLTHKIPLSHVIWHLFVLAGGISFYIGFAVYLT